MSKLCYRLESPPYHPPHLRTDCKSCQSVTSRHLCLHTTLNTTCCALWSYRGIDRIASEFIERTSMFAQLSIRLSLMFTISSDCTLRPLIQIIGRKASQPHKGVKRASSCVARSRKCGFCSMILGGTKG